MMLLRKKVAKVAISIDDQAGRFWIVAVLPFILPFLLVGAFLWLMMRQVQGTNNRAMMFGQARPREFDKKDKKNKVTFRDVAGVKEAKMNWKKLFNFSGILSFGSWRSDSPRCSACGTAELEKRFLRVQSLGRHMCRFSIFLVRNLWKCLSGSALPASEIFQTGEAVSPCIVFIDEIDAVGHPAEPASAVLMMSASRR